MSHYQFFIHELFLYTIASLIKHRRFSELNELTEQGYYIQNSSYSRPQGLYGFKIFDTNSAALRLYNNSLAQSYYSIYGKFIRDRATRSNIKFQDLMQADFFLFIFDHLQKHNENSYMSKWYPNTLAYGESIQNSFEIFTRSQSKKFFEQLKIALGNVTKEELEKLVSEFDEDKRRMPNWSGYYPRVDFFINISKVATRL